MTVEALDIMVRLWTEGAIAYEGEFWRDELGTYSYTLTKGCKDRLPRSQQLPSASR